MMVLSLFLIAVAVALLAVGLWLPSAALLSGSIAASVLAAVTLVAGARRVAAAGTVLAAPPVPATRSRRAASATSHPAVGQQSDLLMELAVAQPEPPPTAGAAASPAESVPVVIPAQGGAARQGSAGRPDEETEPDPPDEPAAQQVSAADAARVGQMSTEVLVVDGRPRYHLPGCVHLLGREHEPIPVAEAIELGFTPCSLCEPDSALLADARRV